MKKTLAYLMVLVVGAALLPSAGCSKSDPLKAASRKLVGVWKGKPSADGEQKKTKDAAKNKGEIDVSMDVPVTVEFKDGGAMTINAMIFALSGTWQVVKAEGNNVTIKSVMEMPSFSFESTDGKQKTETKTSKEEDEFSIVFQTDDRITMTPKKDPDESMTLERQK